MWELGLRVSDAPKVEGLGWGVGVWAQHLCQSCGSQELPNLCLFWITAPSMFLGASRNSKTWFWWNREGGKDRGEKQAGPSRR